MTRNLQDRLMEKVRLDDAGCWIWTGYVANTGYGTFSLGNRPVLTHRIAYELFVGPIPKGLQIDHLCRVRACCNPDHLETVTIAENIARGAWGRSRTHCANGHEYTFENTYIVQRERYPYRACRACKRDVWRRMYYGKKSTS